MVKSLVIWMTMLAALAVAAPAAPPAAAPAGPKPKALVVYWYGHKDAVLMLNGVKDAGELVKPDEQYMTYQVRRAAVQVKPGDVLGLRVPGNDYAGYVSPRDFTVLAAMSGERVIIATDLRSWGWAEGEPPPAFWTAPMAASVKKVRRATNAGASPLREFVEAAGCNALDVVPVPTGKAMTSLKHVVTVAELQNAK